MLPLLKHLFFAFFLDERAFRRWLRGGLMALAAGGLAFADQLAPLIGMPDAVKAIKVASIVAGFVAGAMQSAAARPKAIP